MIKHISQHEIFYFNAIHHNIDIFVWFLLAKIIFVFVINDKVLGNQAAVSECSDLTYWHCETTIYVHLRHNWQCLYECYTRWAVWQDLRREFDYLRSACSEKSPLYSVYLSKLTYWISEWVEAGLISNFNV